MPPKTITVASVPIPGTLFHERWEGRETRGYPINPEYRGSDLSSAKRDAERIGFTEFSFGGVTYTRLEGRWYALVLSDESQGGS